MSVTLDVLMPFRFKVVNDVHWPNICRMFVTFAVLRPFRLMDFIDEQP
jgi:hypothetical protein